jgi:hypothetical protein
MKASQARNRVRDEIIRLNRPLFQKAFPDDKHTSWKTNEGRLIVHIMRTKLGYSPNTVSYDIHYQAFRAYNNFKKKNPITSQILVELKN